MVAEGPPPRAHPPFAIPLYFSTVSCYATGMGRNIIMFKDAPMALVGSEMPEAKVKALPFVSRPCCRRTYQRDHPVMSHKIPNASGCTS